MFTQMFFGLVIVMVYLAFYESADPSELPMTIAQTVTYAWLAQSLLGLLPWRGDNDIQDMIRNGDFAYELVRPLDTYNYWYYRIMAKRIAATIVRCIPLLVIVILFFPAELTIGPPESLFGFLLFLITLIGGVILGGALSNIITISVLFTIGDGIERLFPALVTIFSGMLIPLSFFPDWSQLFLKLLPFSGLVDGPYKFYLGIYEASDLAFVLIHQLFWTVAFIILGRLMINLAKKRIVVQGG
ncbi:hypothetical protein RJG79_11135 [Mycoplasmatota bacterium WC44]